MIYYKKAQMPEQSLVEKEQGKPSSPGSLGKQDLFDIYHATFIHHYKNISFTT